MKKYQTKLENLFEIKKVSSLLLVLLFASLMLAFAVVVVANQYSRFISFSHYFRFYYTFFSPRVGAASAAPLFLVHHS